MHFKFHRVESLPRLAWCARMDVGSSVVTIVHGSWVEVNDSYFVEGVWDGPFVDSRFDNTCAFTGSGCRLDGAAAIFVAPCHTLERLYSVRTDGSLFWSNSLPFLLAMTGLHLDPLYPYYRVDLWSICRGLRRHSKQIPTIEGLAIRLYYFCNIRVDSDLEIREDAKPLPPDWRDFAEYRDFMLHAATGMSENLSAPQRQVRYTLLSSMSSGYDSPASSALAAKAGCRRIVTFDTGTRYKTDRATVSDSGAEIARALGLEVHEFAQTDCSSFGQDVAAEFAACGDSYDFQLATFEPELSQKLFVSGLHGDGAWNGSRTPNSEIRRRIPSGISLTEFRLRVGFQHLPLPFLGIVRQPTMHRISNSAEMRPWTLNNGYDRPIPRRILEEMGVPRNSFGQVKKGSFAIVRLGRGSRLHLPSFEEFYKKYAARLGVFTRTQLRAQYLRALAVKKCGALAERLGMPNLVAQWDDYWLFRPGRSTFIMTWGNVVLRDRYAAAIEGTAFGLENADVADVCAHD